MSFKDVRLSALFLLICGVNTNVFDYAYNTPLHYLGFLANQNNASLRIVKPIYNELINYSFLGTYNNQSIHHFDYAGQNRVHLDAVNVFNATAYDIFPSFKHIDSNFDIKLFPLKCLAARQVHKTLFRCPQCRYLSMYNYEKFSKKLYDLDVGLPSKEKLFYELFKANGFGLKYKEKASYFDHLPRDFDAPNVWRLSKIFAQQLNISEKLLEFIEMHGPCKIIHYLPFKLNNYCIENGDF